MLLSTVIVCYKREIAFALKGVDVEINAAFCCEELMEEWFREEGMKVVG